MCQHARVAVFDQWEGITVCIYIIYIYIIYIYYYIYKAYIQAYIVGRGCSLADSSPFVRRVAELNAALTAT